MCSSRCACVNIKKCTEGGKSGKAKTLPALPLPTALAKIMYLPWTLGVSVLELGPSLCFFCTCNSEVVLLTADLQEYKCNVMIHFQLWNYDPSSDFLGIFSFHGNDLWCAILFPSMEKMIKNTQELSWPPAFKFVFVGFIIFKPGHFIRPCLTV